jgi:hypothetical protein
MDYYFPFYIKESGDLSLNSLLGIFYDYIIRGVDFTFFDQDIFISFVN